MAANRGCMQLDNSNYSAPIPVIGVYITAASLVCFLAMLHDIISGFRNRKRWLPCRWFSLNSITLTLLATAAKLPVDLTTSMPSARDQFSKLTGTTMICTSMAFFMSALGKNHISESMNNMVALSIFVVTVIVNIFIQILTGVIVFFVTEHIIIMCVMIVILSSLWMVTMDFKSQKNFSLDLKKDLVTKGTGSMFQRLKSSYVYGHYYDPEITLCKKETCHFLGLLSVLCSVVIIQAWFRILTREFCGESSDYRWSVWLVVVSQTLAILLASFAASVRWIGLLSHIKGRNIIDQNPESVIFANPLLKLNAWERFSISCVLPITLLVVLVFCPLRPVFTVVKIIERIISKLCFKPKRLDPIGQEYLDLVGSEKERLEEWTLAKSVKDMNRWLQASSGEPPNHFSALLSQTPPSQQLEAKDLFYPDKDGIQVSSLSIALLVRIAQICLKSEHSAPLLQAYDQVHETIHYIDNRVNSVSFNSRKRARLAQAVWNGDDFSSLLPKIREGTSKRNSELAGALVIIRNLKTALHPDFVSDEVGRITNFINRGNYSSMAEFSNYIQKMFVDMVHIVFAKLPHAIFKEVSESSAEDFDERVRLGLKFICRTESLEAQILWSFPVQCDITSLITTPRDSKGDIGSAIDASTSTNANDVINSNSAATHDDVIVPIE